MQLVRHSTEETGIMDGKGLKKDIYVSRNGIEDREARVNATTQNLNGVFVQG